MVKRVLFLAVVLVIVVGIAGATGLMSYVRTGGRLAQESVVESVPISFQIERARDLVRDLEPVIRTNEERIAKEEVAIDELEEKIADLRTRLVEDQADVLRLKSDLENGEPMYVYAGRQYTRERVENDLSNRFERYKTNEATLASLEKVHDARLAGLEAARRKLSSMKASKTQLLVDIQNLQARLQMVEATAATSEYHFDEGELGDVQELVDDLDTRLQVAERLVQSDSYYPDEIPLDEGESAGIVDRVAEYFGTDQPDVGVVAER